MYWDTHGNGTALQFVKKIIIHDPKNTYISKIAKIFSIVLPYKLGQCIWVKKIDLSNWPKTVFLHVMICLPATSLNIFRLCIQQKFSYGSLARK